MTDTQDIREKVRIIAKAIELLNLLDSIKHNIIQKSSVLGELRH